MKHQWPFVKKKKKSGQQHLGNTESWKKKETTSKYLLPILWDVNTMEAHLFCNP